MSDFDQTNYNGEGFESYPEMPMDFSTFIKNKMETKQSQDNGTTFDPHKLMVNKKKIEDGEPVDLPEPIKWPEKDIKALESFCQKYGLYGISCGRMSPIAMIAFLKNKMGIVDGPLEERVPYGYTKIGQSAQKPSLLHG